MNNWNIFYNMNDKKLIKYLLEYEITNNILNKLNIIENEKELIKHKKNTIDKIEKIRNELYRKNIQIPTFYQDDEYNRKQFKILTKEEYNDVYINYKLPWSEK